MQKQTDQPLTYFTKRMDLTKSEGGTNRELQYAAHYKAQGVHMKRTRHRA